MSDSPFITILLFAGAAYLFKLWLDDLRALENGKPNENAFPGATRSSRKAVIIGVAGALALVAIETAGEIGLGVSAEQSDITVLFLLAMVGAGVLEEVVFRGYLVVKDKGRNLLIVSIAGFSLLFALLHYQYYTEVPEGGSWTDTRLDLDPKSLWTLLILFLNSLWFYSVRFFKWNPHHSLLPCFAAHIASNIGVFVVKALQGHVSGLY